jgi:hypothetical protein
MINRLSVAGPYSGFGLAGANPAESWPGFWHGVIAPITFIVG